jgi:hypothetical protein
MKRWIQFNAEAVVFAFVVVLLFAGVVFACLVF